MARKYYTLLIREDGKWAPHFGDYDRKTVADEGDELWYKGASRKDLKIICTSVRLKDVNAKIDELNSKGRLETAN